MMMVTNKYKEITVKNADGDTGNNKKALDFSKSKNLVRSQELIISLTSYPARIGTVNQTIESLLNQTMKADKVILWLAPEQFPNKEADLPQQLLDLRNKGLTIDWYHDIKSYKKLIPALRRYPDAVIVTADDDILYPVDWLQKLWESYSKSKTSKFINCHRAHRIDFDRKIQPYSGWERCVSNEQPSFFNFCTTGGGVLYPPHTFSDEVFNEEAFVKLCPTGDDVWFWAMCVLNNKKIRTVANNIRCIKTVEGTQEDSLWKENITQNDEQIKHVISHYPAVQKKLLKEKHNKYFKTCLLFPWYLYKTFKLRKEHDKQVFDKIKNDLRKYRVDIRYTNKPGNVDVNGNVDVSRPGWMNGYGVVVSSANQKQHFNIKPDQDGKLALYFRGHDCRHKGTRFPVYIIYKSIKIDGLNIPKMPVNTWHDQPFKYELNVKNGQNISIDIETSDYNYSEYELYDVACKTHPSMNIDKQKFIEYIKK